MLTVELSDLIASSGVGYAATTAGLDGRRVRIEGPLFRDRRGTLGIGLMSPGCSHGGSEVSIAIVGVPAALALVRSGIVVRVTGTMDYGFDVDHNGTATYLRLRDVRLVPEAVAT